MKSINTVEKKDEEDYRDGIHAPYVKGMSEKLQYDLSKLGIGFVMKKEKTLHSELCKLKIRKKDGETSQQFRTRKYQHNQDLKNKGVTNAIYLHLKEQKKHKVDWDNAIFLDSEAQ